MVSKNVCVVLEVFQHFLVGPFPMIELESSCDFNRIPRPVQRRGFSKQRAATPVEQAADHFMFWVVIRSLGIFVHVKPGIPPDTPLTIVIAGVGESFQIKDSETLPDV